MGNADLDAECGREGESAMMVLLKAKRLYVKRAYRRWRTKMVILAKVGETIGDDKVT